MASPYPPAAWGSSYGYAPGYAGAQAGSYGGGGYYSDPAAAYYQMQGAYAGVAAAPPIPSVPPPAPPPASSSPPPPPPPPGADAPPGTGEDNSLDKSALTAAAAAPPPPPNDASNTAATPAAQATAATQVQAPTSVTAVAAAAQQHAYDYQQYYQQYYGPAGAYGAGYNAAGYAGYPNTYPPYQQQYPQQQQQQPPPYPGMQQPHYGAYGGGPPINAPSGATQHAAGASQTISPSNKQSRWQQQSAGPGSKKDSSYNAVAPPSLLTITGSNRVPVSIRPQMPGKPVTSTAAPAYVRVGSGSGHSLQPAPAAAAKPATTSGSSNSGGKFPPTFTAWVERCFEHCRSDVDRTAMTQALTKRITAVEKAGRMWLVDWDKEPYPTLTDSTTLPSPTASAGSRNGYGAPTGLRSKRSRWEEPDLAPAAVAGGKGGKRQQQLQQLQQLQPLTKKQRKLLKQQQQLEQQQVSAEPMSYSEQQKLKQRAGRFGDGRAQGGVQWSGRQRRGEYFDEYDDDMDVGYDDSDDAEFDESSTVAIQGTCTELEKSYFRLTGPPDPSVVRSPAVLRKALDRLVGLLHRGAVNWFYACDQFKGMRQDCTVQHLRNELSVAVYEAHARSALEYGDLAEFNQCQTQLASLYADGIPGCVAEFMAYKVLYHTVHARSSAKQALLHTLRAALAFQQQQPGVSSQAGTAGGGGEDAVANALRARKALFADNFREFFAAYAAAPVLGRALLDSLVPHVRWTALNMIVKAYKTSVPVSFLANMLGFIARPCSSDGSGDAAAGAAGNAAAVPLPGCRQAVYVGKAAGEASEEEGAAACVRWLQAHGAVLEAEGSSSPLLDVKASLGKLVIPEEPKVAHGDENLSLGDFLARASGLKA